MDTILEEDIDKNVEPEEISEINVKDCETMDKGGESLEDTTHICGEGGSFNLKFMAKVKSRGRPRGTGASRTSFKNKKKNMKKKNKTDKGKRLIDLTDQKDTDTSGLNPVSMRDRVMCLHPP